VDGLRACADWRATGLSREVLAVTPAIWHDETLVAAPLAGLENGWSARIDAPFDLFGLSH
jgi:tRNA(Ile)-lysidine synthase